MFHLFLWYLSIIIAAIKPIIDTLNDKTPQTPLIKLVNPSVEKNLAERIK